MREYSKEQILENYGEEALETISKYLEKHDVNTLLVYADEYTFEIVGGILAGHSMTVDYALNLLDINMDEFSQSQGWDDWDFEALRLIDVE